MAYAQRLERDADAGVREALRVLHQGLSCLAGQISATDSHCAHVAAQLTNNWEEMARRLSDMRLDLDTSRRVLEARLSASEKSAQYNSSALEHALEKIEALARQRAMDQADNLRQASRHEQLLERLSDAFLRLEKRAPEPNSGHRLEAVEEAVAGLTGQKKPDQPGSPLLAGLEALAQRLEALEKDRAALLAELRADRSGPQADPEPSLTEPPPTEPPALEPAESDVAEAPDFEDIFARPEPVNSLARARISAGVPAEESRPRHLFFLGAVLAAVLGLAAVLALDWQAQTPAAAKPASAPRTFVLPEPPNADATQFVIAPQPGDDRNDPAPQRLNPDSRDSTPQAPLPHSAHNARIKSAANSPKSSAQPASTPSANRVRELAAQGNVIALTILGLKAADGTGGAAGNLAEAIKYLTQAAEKGQAMAQYRLGALYEHGQGVAIDPFRASHWYELSANQGNRKAMHNLAVFYASRKDMADAARWFAKAAALGLPDSQFNLAILYERGDGVPQSFVDAFKWYAIAATAGDAESRARMSLLQSHISDADKAIATQAAAAFHPLTFDQGANTAPQASDLPSG